MQPVEQQQSWIDWLPESLSGRINRSHHIRSALLNTGWLFFDRLFRLGIGLVIGVWIARYLGPVQFGVYNYALSFTVIIGTLASLGLDSIVVRELVNFNEQKRSILGTAIVLRVLGGALVVVVALIASFIPQSIDSLTRSLIVVFAIAYPFQAADVFDYWFQAHVQSKYSVIARNSAFIVVTGLKVAALFFHAPLIMFALLATLETIVAGFGLLIAYHQRGEKAHEWRFEYQRALKLLRDSWPLTLSGLAILIYMRVDQVILGEMLGPQAVGIYAAAVRVVEVWYFIPTAIASSVFPAILQAKQQDPGLYLRRLQQLYDGMALISILIGLVLTLFSSQIIVLLFGEAYRQASSVLVIYVWSGVGTFLGVASSQFLMAENYTRLSMYRTVIGMVLNVALNFLLIPHFGLAGSAFATLVSYTASTFSLVFFTQGRGQVAMMLKSLLIYRLFVTRRLS